MFGADAAQLSFSMHETRPRAQPKQTDSFQYLFPKFCNQSPWRQVSSAPHGHVHDSSHYEDCILIAEFSEQEGPRPVLVIPKDGGQNFDKNEFSVKILAVDHQSSIVEGCEMTEDAQVVMSDPDTDTHAFIHHIVLNDIQARGYVRPFCISYVTSDPIKVMKCYEEISSQMKKVARLMKYGNRLVFMRDLEKHLEDLSYTKAHLLISQSRNSQVSAQGDSDLFNALNTIRQCMEEVTDILNNLKPVIQVETELSERFQSYERLLKGKQTSNKDPDSSSLQDFDTSGLPGQDKELSGSYTDSPEFSLFIKSKDQKPKLLDVSTIRGKRRFDRSLRGLHELCSWGAKEGLQRLRAFREFLKRDLSSIYTDELDMAALEPEIGVLSFGYNTVGANFLSSNDSYEGRCCMRRMVNDLDHERSTLASLGSVDSFQSLSTSFQSFDEDPMYSANSSMVDTHPHTFILDRQNSISDGSIGRGSLEERDFMFGNDYSMSLKTAVDLDLCMPESRSFMETLTEHGQGQAVVNDYNKESSLESGDFKENIKVTETKVRASSDSSDFDCIDISKDTTCASKGCSCLKGKTENGLYKCGNGCQTCKNTNDAIEPNSMNIKLRFSANGVNDACEEGSSSSEQREECNNDKNDVENFNKVEQAVENNIEDIDEVDVDTEKTEANLDLTDSTTTLCDQNAVIVDSNDRSKSSDDNSQLLDIENNDCDILIYNEEMAANCDTAISHSAPSREVQSCENLCVNAVRDGQCVCAKGTDLEEMWKVNCVNENLGDREKFVEKCVDKEEDEKATTEELSQTKKEHFPSAAGVRTINSSSFSSGTKPALLRRFSTGEPANRRKLKFLHSFKSIQEGERSIGQSLHKVLCGFNNMQHVVYSLLLGRPVVVIGTRKQEAIIRDCVQALSLFVTSTPSTVSLLCLIKQLKMTDVHKFQLRGIIRPDRRSVDYLLPKSIRRYLTVMDVEKSAVHCQAYHGILLNGISALHTRKKSFKSDTALLSYLQLWLEEISTKAFQFYHCIISTDDQLDIRYRGTTVPHRSVMLELSSEKYLNKAGFLNSDCKIIKHLAELVKIQQIEEEFKCKFLTDPPAYPFSVMYQAIQMFRL